MKRSLVLLLAALAFNSPSRGAGTDSAGTIIREGEVLQYKVKWTFFRLGTVTLRTVRDSTCREPGDIKVIMSVESNPDLSFIWIREFNECVVDTRTIDSRSFHARHRNGETYTEIWHTVDRSQHRTLYRVIDKNSGKELEADTLRGVESFVEGPSLFLLARCLSQSSGTKNVPTLVGGKLSTTELTYGGDRELIDIGAVGNPVRVRKFLGTAHWQGGTEAGLGGEFTGWISDDGAAVPIVAEVKVLIGSIKLELESWTRTGWAPPSGGMLSAMENAGGKTQ
ncbi:MAG TPA: DUF3108 domain-containing protein [Bacteroidota bacterium]|nr:DUF3108 domain-containing protein [Bacteroidota bacterium]